MIVLYRVMCDCVIQGDACSLADLMCYENVLVYVYTVHAG